MDPITKACAAALAMAFNVTSVDVERVEDYSTMEPPAVRLWVSYQPPASSDAVAAMLRRQAGQRDPVQTRTAGPMRCIFAGGATAPSEICDGDDCGFISDQRMREIQHALR